MRMKGQSCLIVVPTSDERGVGKHEISGSTVKAGDEVLALVAYQWLGKFSFAVFAVEGHVAFS